MQKVTIVTHNGSFHADEVFATATLQMALGDDKQYEIVRSRNPEDWVRGDYVVDVGGVYDASTNHFDHHQEGGAGGRENGVDYSSFGLVWKTFGEIVCGGADVAHLVDEHLVQPIDAIDNGQDLFTSRIAGVRPFDVSTVIALMRPSFEETPQDYDIAFLSAVKLARQILEREIVHSRGTVVGKQKSRELISASPDSRLSYIDHMYPWESVAEEFPELLFVYYQTDPEVWRLKTVRKSADSFEARKDLPATWAGKKDEELRQVTGVPDAIFCHRKRFLCGAKTKEGILKLAELALKE